MMILVAVVLGMLFFLNTIKLKALMTEATASRLHLAIDMIEAGLRKDPRLRITPHSVGNFDALAEAAMERFPEIEGFFLFGTRGPRVLAEVGHPPGRMHIRPVFMRVMSPKFARSAQDLHGTLFSGRRILDPSGKVAGAVVLHLPVNSFGPEFRDARSRLLRRYVLIFCALVVLLIPITYFQFRRLGRTYRALSPGNITASSGKRGIGRGQDTDILAEIAAGNAAYGEAAAELTDILPPDARAKDA